MIYLEARLTVVPGKMNEFMEVFGKEYLPASNKLGRKLVGQFRTTIGTLDEITDLWAYEDLAHLQGAQETRARSPEMMKAGEKLRALIAHETTRLMVPTPLSEMK